MHAGEGKQKAPTVREGCSELCPMDGAVRKEKRNRYGWEEPGSLGHVLGASPWCSFAWGKVGVRPRGQQATKGLKPMPSASL